MSVGPFSAGAVLGAIATLVGAGVPLLYRYVYGSKSRVTLSRISTIDDSEWRDGRNENQEVWSRRVLMRASNNGWRDGVIGGVELREVIIWDSDGERTVVQNPQPGVDKIELENFHPDGETTRLSIQQRTNYGGQIISGRGDELIASLPFILQKSELGRMMQRGERALFSFDFTVEDNKRIYSATVDVTTELTDSAGGDLTQ